MLHVLLVADPSDIGILLTDLAAKAQGGEYLAAFGAFLGILVLVLRLLLGWKVSWFKTRLGGLALVFGTSLLGSIGASLRLGDTGFLTILLVALSAAWTATGIHTHVKDAMAALAERSAKKNPT